MKIQRWMAAPLMILLGSIAGFCVLEGVCSLIVLVGSIITYRSPSFNEQVHTTYDSELGWGNRRSIFVPDLYGPGIFLTTNSLGFRGRAEVPAEAPKDRLRIICSGDSFTLGYGVDDDHAWCARLRALDSRLETVNMGQGGYGVDQAYLWYLRDGNRIEHAVHVFAVITDDFFRMQRPTFLSYGKPMLAIEDGKLVEKNVPVPKLWSSSLPRLAMRVGPALKSLRARDLGARFRKRFAADEDDGGGRRFDEQTWQIAAKVFEVLHELNRARGGTLLVVYLAAGEDYMTSTESDPWRVRLRAHAAKVGFAYLDLVPALRELPPDRMTPLFLSQRPPGRGHYSNLGNEWTARRILDEIVKLPQVSARLARSSN